MHNLEKYCRTPFRPHCYILHSHIMLLEITVPILSFISMNDCSGKVHRAVLQRGKDVATRISAISVAGHKSTCDWPQTECAV